MKLTCAGGQSFCAGAVELAAVARAPGTHNRHPRIALVLGETHFRIAVSRTKVILVKLRRKALKRLSARSSIKAVVTANATDARGRVVIARRRVQLRLRLPAS